MPEWDAELEVDTVWAARLIEQQFPELSAHRPGRRPQVAPLAKGWDNVGYLVNDRWVFRFPRRAIGATLMESEIRAMPLVARHLAAANADLAVTAPRLVGRPEGKYPWSFAGYEMIPGTTACRARLADHHRAAMGPRLGHFLRALHTLSGPQARATGAPVAGRRRMDLPRLIAKGHEYLARARNAQLLTDTAAIEATLASAPSGWEPQEDTLVHGDLYVRHLVIDAAGALAGIIDWGDVHVSDPAADLAIAHLVLPPREHNCFRDAYGSISQASWTVARLRALVHAMITLLYGADQHDHDLVRESRQGLAYITAAR